MSETPAHSSFKTAVSSEGTFYENSGNSTRQHAYGIPIKIHQDDTKGSFPNPGSVLGPYFCLGQLGKGTFSSIHKCCYIGGTDSHLAAAKVEIGDEFSGVLDLESTMLDYLHQHLPPESVPKYYGYYKAPKVAALFMECLDSPDLHRLRESIGPNRRMHMHDAIHLCADVLIPLLQSMHTAGIVHRDVKPSNCIAVSRDSFRMVDFGLSKSIVVPANSESADATHPYPSHRPWLKPHRGNAATTDACFKKERSNAEFRGTSMYASLFVHQGKDYAPRDDMWSVLYVFCDLVSGGLPWMTYAANRERNMCERSKAMIFTENKYDTLLRGDAYHIGMHKREMAKRRKVDPQRLPIVPNPLYMSQDSHKVKMLEMAFNSLKNLEFWSTPDYDLLISCLREFANESVPPSVAVDPPVASIQWDRLVQPPDSPSYQKSGMPEFLVHDAPCPLSENDFAKAESELEHGKFESDPWSRLPVKLRYHLAQLDGKPFSPVIGLRDFMTASLMLLHGEWEAKRFEDGGHRTSTDGFRRQRYVELLQKCETFGQTYVNQHECFYQDDGKRRKLTSSKNISPLVMVSRVMSGLRWEIAAEQKKMAAPPVRISFDD